MAGSGFASLAVHDPIRSDFPASVSNFSSLSIDNVGLTELPLLPVDIGAVQLKFQLHILLRGLINILP